MEGRLENLTADLNVAQSSKIVLEPGSGVKAGEADRFVYFDMGSDSRNTGTQAVEYEAFASLVQVVRISGEVCFGVGSDLHGLVERSVPCLM